MFAKTTTLRSLVRSWCLVFLDSLLFSSLRVRKEHSFLFGKYLKRLIFSIFRAVISRVYEKMLPRVSAEITFLN